MIVLFILMFFGSKSIPKIARTLGRGMRQFRDASQEIQREITDSARDITDNARQIEKSETLNEIKDELDISKHLDDK